MSMLLARDLSAPRREVPLEAFGALVPISRSGGQGRVYRPEHVPAGLGATPAVVKLYHRAPPAGAAHALDAMAAWSDVLAPARRAQLLRLAAWPLATVSSEGRLAGIVMQDVSPRFSVPFLMPSGRAQSVLLALEHLLGGDWYLERRGLGIHLDTVIRAVVAERISGALAFMHQHGIVVGDLAPSNLLVSFRDGRAVSFIDCDSMVFHGRPALTSVETGDWQMPRDFSEASRTRAADAYKLGLVVLRLFARSHDARAIGPHEPHVPAQLRGLLARALAPDAANRPPAGEWQRALAHLLSAPDLGRRYPGPATRPPPPPQPQRINRRPQPDPSTPSLRPLLASQGARRPLSPVMWVALVIAFVLLLSQLLAAMPSQNSAQSSGFTGGGRPTIQYYYPGPSGGGAP